MPRLSHALAACTLLAPGPALAQLTSGGTTGGSTGTISNSLGIGGGPAGQGSPAAGSLSGAGNLSTSTIGRPPSPLGARQSLSQSIDARAGLGRTGSGTGYTGSLSSSVSGNATSTRTTGGFDLNSAGRPAGTPLGTSSNPLQQQQGATSSTGN